MSLTTTYIQNKVNAFFTKESVKLFVLLFFLQIAITSFSQSKQNFLGKHLTLKGNTLVNTHKATTNHLGTQLVLVNNTLVNSTKLNPSQKVVRATDNNKVYGMQTAIPLPLFTKTPAKINSNQVKPKQTKKIKITDAFYTDEFIYLNKNSGRIRRR